MLTLMPPHVRVYVCLMKKFTSSPHRSLVLWRSGNLYGGCGVLCMTFIVGHMTLRVTPNTLIIPLLFFPFPFLCKRNCVSKQLCPENNCVSLSIHHSPHNCSFPTLEAPLHDEPLPGRSIPSQSLI